MRKVAFIVGNGDYQNIPSLKNPKNDSSAIRDKLKEMGFNVDYYSENLTQEAFQKRVKEFVEDNQQFRPDIAFFYYAGHGLQRDRENFIMPVDFEKEIDRDSDVNRQLRENSISFDQVDEAFKSINAKSNIFILDACRDNPYSELNIAVTNDRGVKYHSSTKSRNIEISDISENLIVFATSPDKTASDGDHNGLFTKHLLKYISLPNRTIQDVLKLTSKDVVKESEHQQVPWIHDGIHSGEVMLNLREDLTFDDFNKDFTTESSETADQKTSKLKTVSIYIALFFSLLVSAFGFFYITFIEAFDMDRDKGENISQLYSIAVATAGLFIYKYRRDLSTLLIGSVFVLGSSTALPFAVMEPLYFSNSTSALFGISVSIVSVSIFVYLVIHQYRKIAIYYASYLITLLLLIVVGYIISNTLMRGDRYDDTAFSVNFGYDFSIFLILTLFWKKEGRNAVLSRSLNDKFLILMGGLGIYYLSLQLFTFPVESILDNFYPRIDNNFYPAVSFFKHYLSILLFLVYVATFQTDRKFSFKFLSTIFLVYFYYILFFQIYSYTISIFDIKLPHDIRLLNIYFEVSNLMNYLILFISLASSILTTLLFIHKREERVIKTAVLITLYVGLVNIMSDFFHYFSGLIEYKTLYYIRDILSISTLLFAFIFFTRYLEKLYLLAGLLFSYLMAQVISPNFGLFVSNSNNDYMHTLYIFIGILGSYVFYKIVKSENLK